MPPKYSCRSCATTSYRQVIARDSDGVMRPSGMYACTGCKAVFADLKEWRSQEFEEHAAINQNKVRRFGGPGHQAAS